MLNVFAKSAYNPGMLNMLNMLKPNEAPKGQPCNIFNISPILRAFDQNI